MVIRFVFFLLDKQFSTKEEYLWGDVRLPLEYIIADLQDKLNIFGEKKRDDTVRKLSELASDVAKKADLDYVEGNLTALDGRIGRIEADREGLDLEGLLSDFHGRIQRIEEAREALDKAIACNRSIRVVVKETLKDAGAPWWAEVLGGVGGGVLGGLGSVLGGLISAKGAAAGGLAKSVGGNAIDAVNGVLSAAGTTLEGIADLLSGIQNTVNDLKNSPNFAPEFDSSHLEARIR